MSIEDDLRTAARQWIEAGGTQADLADRAGIKQQTVSEWLRGINRTRLEVAERIGAAIGRPLRMDGEIDPWDTLGRIKEEWEGLHLSCDCPEGTACSVCEIQYLLDEAVPADEE